MLLYLTQGNPVRKYALRTPSTITTALNAVIAANNTRVVFRHNTAPVFVNCNTYTVMDFDGLSTGPIRHINSATHTGVVGTGAGPAAIAASAAAAAAVSAAAALSPAAAATATATAANQALVAQQATAAAAAARFSAALSAAIANTTADAAASAATQACVGQQAATAAAVAATSPAPFDLQNL